MSRPAEVKIADSVSTLISLLDDVVNLPSKPPSLFFDLEGIKLGRHGSISIVSLFIAPKNIVYLVDIHCLRGAAFTTTNGGGISLKAIFESSAIPKVCFDVRNDSDALFGEYQISVNSIEDLQLMELANRKGSKTFVAALAKCIEKDSGITVAELSEWERVKASATQVFDPEKGESHEVINERPLKPEIVSYCVNNVVHLPELYGVYETKLRPPGETFWRVQVQNATTKRIKLSQRPDYDGQPDCKVYGPWDAGTIERDRDQWNEEVKSDGLHGGDEDSGEDGWDDDMDPDTARDCEGWEDDMIKNGECF